MTGDELDPPSTGKVETPSMLRYLDQIIMAQSPELHCVLAGVDVGQLPFQVQRGFLAQFRDGNWTPLTNTA